MNDTPERCELCEGIILEEDQRPRLKGLCFACSEDFNPMSDPATELPLTVYCPGCGGYVLLIGEKDFECDCGCVFDVRMEDGKTLIDVICEGKEPAPSLTPTK